MKLDHQNSHVETDIDRSQTREFVIKQNAHTFRILSDSIYSDKPLAVVRELGCNAWDSHIQAGKTDTPFNIHLPSSYEPFFSIKDFGVGLAEDDIYDLYCTYGGTNKDQSNDFTGGFGLGSKSPFAYTDQFTVTSIHGGKKMIFNAFIAENGSPNIVKLSEVDSSEPNGLEVYMPVQDKDFGAFKEKSKKIFKRFPVMPLMDGIDEFKVDPVEYVTCNDLYKLRKADGNSYYRSDEATALMGLVAYPLKKDSIDGLTGIQRSLLDTPIDIIFEMGTISMTASRENLNYDNNTVKAIKKKLDEVIEDLPKALQKELSDCKNIWEANEVYNKWYMKNQFDYQLRDHIGKSVKFRGKEINGSIRINLYDAVDVEYDCPIDQKKKTRKENEHYGEFLEFNKSVFDLKRISARREASMSFKPGSEGIIIWDDEKARSTNIKIDFNFRDEGQAVTLLRLDNAKDIKRVEKELGGYKLKKLSDYPDAPKGFYERKVSERQVRKLLAYNGCYESWSDKNVDHDVADGGLYVMTYKRTPQLGQGGNPKWDIRSTHSHLRDLINRAKDAGVLEEDFKLFGIQASFSNIVKNNEGWVHIEDYIEEKLQKKIDGLNLNRAMADKKELKNHLDSEYKHFFKKFDERQDEWRSVRAPMARLHKAVSEMSADVEESILDLIKMSKTVKFREIKPTHNLHKLSKLCANRYPLINYTDVLYKHYASAKHYIDVCDASPSINLETKTGD